jgi:hypothetical protein
MIKPTPNPPEHEDTSPYESFDSKKLHEAAERALDLHLGTPPDKKSKRRNGDLFIVAPDLHTETVLANASEDLLSISAICSGQLIPDTVLSFSSVFAGASPSLN